MEPLDPPIQIAILAAGMSTRLGFPKQLLLLKGQTLVARMVAEASRVCGARVLVVTGANRDRVLKSLNGFAYQEVWNDQFARGIGSSLRCLREKLLEQGSLDQPMMVVACDQIFVDHRVLEMLIEQYWKSTQGAVAKRCAIVCHYGSDMGLPVILSPCLWEDLGSLKDNEGAKKIWQSPEVDLRTISCPQAQWDIDTREDCRIHGIEHSFLGND